MVAQREFAELEPRVDLSMGRKIIEIPLENEGIRGSGGLGICEKMCICKKMCICEKMCICDKMCICKKMCICEKMCIDEKEEREEEAGGRTGCIQNENPHSEAWWEKMGGARASANAPPHFGWFSEILQFFF